MEYFNSNDARNLINIYGFSIFPLHGYKDGRCTCGNPNCSNIAKHPATPNGLKDASKDIEQVKTLWKGRKALNPGIATGAISGIFVIDIDSSDGKDALLTHLGVNTLPETLTVKTAKGWHLYFKHPGEPVITKTNIMPSVDVRGDGGYVVGPGGIHASSHRYEFLNPLEDIQEPPDQILDLVVKSRIRKPMAEVAQLYVKENKKLFETRDGWSETDVQDHLAHISPDCSYDDWMSVGMALQDEGIDFSVYDKWSAKGSKYKDSQDVALHWNSFDKGKGTSYGTVVHLAKQGGWKPNTVTPKPNSGKICAESVQEFAQNRAETQVIENKEENSDTTLVMSPDKELRELPILYASDIRASLDTDDFVEDILCERQFSVIYGESNCGKTFFMLDLAMHVALGRTWRDKEVEQGGVIYAALEGGYGTRNRVSAFRSHHQILQDIPLAVIPSNLDFLDTEGDILSLVQAIEIAQERIGGVKLVVIDTLARAIGGGDENSGQDMGLLVRNADLIREVTGAHIAFIHHSGKDAVKGARGHSSLRAAVDTEIEISRPNEHSPSAIKVVKQREMEMVQDMAFTLKAVELGESKRGKQITSCVVTPCEVAEVSKRDINLNAKEKFVLDSIKRALDTSGESRRPYGTDGPLLKVIDYYRLADQLEEDGYGKLFDSEKDDAEEKSVTKTRTARLGLKKKGYIGFNRAYIWLLDEEVSND